MTEMPTKYKGLFPDETSGDLVNIEYRFWEGVCIFFFEHETEVHFRMTKWWFIWNVMIRRCNHQFM